MKLKIDQWALTPHAAQRLLERDITIEELSLVISNPEEIIEQGPKFILTKTFPQRKDNKVAAVILEKKGYQLWLIITVMVNFQSKR